MKREKHVETCLVIVTGLLVLWYFFREEYLIYAAIAIGIIGAFIPALAARIHWAWYKLAEMLGFVMSKVILSLVFFLFLFPIALIYRVSKGDGMKIRRKENTYWTTRNHSYTSADLEKMW